MTMTSEQADEMIRLLKPVSRYCELRLTLKDMENEAKEAEEDARILREQEARFRLASPEQKAGLFDGVMRTILACRDNYDELSVDGVVDGECDEVEEFLESRGFSGLFSFDAPEIEQLVNKVDEMLSGDGE